MNVHTSVPKINLKQHNHRVKVLLEKLRTKLDKFSVLDDTGHYVGEVQDVKLDSSRQLNLVICHPDFVDGSSCFLLKSSYIDQVDSVSKVLFVDANLADMNGLPHYHSSNQDLETNGENKSPNVVDLNASLEVKNGSVMPEFSQDDTSKEICFSEDEITPNSISKENQDEHEDESNLDDCNMSIMEEEVIRLLEERLVVEQRKRKVGDVIVRKEIHTRMVQVPVRSEKLIVEQISPEHKSLAEIDLGSEEIDISGFELHEPIASETALSNGHHRNNGNTVSGEFKSPKSASLFLNAIALQRHHGCAKVRVELVLEDDTLHKTYEEWFERCSGS